jgi:hypothetical protein
MTKVTIKKYLTYDRISGLFLIILSIIGLLHIVFSGEWGRNIGLGAKFMPQIYFFIILITGILLLIRKGEGEKPQGILIFVNIRSVLLFTGVGILYFLFILKVGLVISTVIYALSLYSLLTINPLKNWKQIVISSTIVTIIVWVLFDIVIHIVLPIPLLF